MKGQVEIPQTSEEMEELLNDDGRMADVLKNGEFGDLTARLHRQGDGDQRQKLAAQMREQLQLGKQQVLQAWAEQGMAPQNGFRPGGAAVSQEGRPAQPDHRPRGPADAGRRVPG